MSGYTIKEYNGTKEWHRNGKLHREDGPAVEFADGAKSWWLYGKPHRVDGPAFEEVNGTKEWWLNGKYHREDGPSREYANGTKEWWVNDIRISKEEFTNKVKNKKFTASEIASLKSYGIEVDI
jgi:hypothetical protein